ncbi:MAG: hypothetical protein ACSHX7_10020 [Luteolibacter sp.]
MSVRNFIQASSVLLLAWLCATYFHTVPAERYNQIRSVDTASTEAASSQQDEMGAAMPKEPITR